MTAESNVMIVAGTPWPILSGRTWHDKEAHVNLEYKDGEYAIVDVGPWVSPSPVAASRARAAAWLKQRGLVLPADLWLAARELT